VEAIAHCRLGDVDRRLGLALMLHDAPEYVIGDMISPFKAVIGDSYKSMERRLLTAIHRRFGLPAELPGDVVALVKDADRAAAYLEATKLAGFAPTEAKRFFGPDPALPPALEQDYITPWPAEIAEKRYLDQFKKLAER